MSVREWILFFQKRKTHHSCKQPAHPHNEQDVEDGWSNNGPHSHVALGDKDTCKTTTEEVQTAATEDIQAVTEEVQTA